jgi:hypothetical protein
MDKKWTLAGTAVQNGEVSWRFGTNDLDARKRNLERAGFSDVRLVQLPQAMTREEAMQYVQAHGLLEHVPAVVTPATTTVVDKPTVRQQAVKVLQTVASSTRRNGVRLDVWGMELNAVDRHCENEALARELQKNSVTSFLRWDDQLTAACRNEWRDKADKMAAQRAQAQAEADAVAA